MTETIHLGLPYLAAAQAQKHVIHNEALLRLDALVQLAVHDATLADPPEDPEEGDRYIVATDATGAWSGHAGEVAVLVDGAWSFLAPRDGWIAFDAASASVLVRHGADWTAIGTFLGPLARLGVNTTADDTNRLAVRSEAVLLAAVDEDDGGSGDLRLVASKEGEANTVSLVLQTGFSGRAEIGLTGDDDLVVKVSADGADWIEAMRVDGASGVPAIRYDNTTSGLAATMLHGAVDELAVASVAGPPSASDGAPAVFDGTSGRLLGETTFADLKASLSLAKADVGLGNVDNVPQRERLTANRIYYVRTDGADGNDGLADSAGGAFLTIQKAVDVAASLDTGGYTITIQVGDGTYAGGVVLRNVPGFRAPGDLVIQGNGGTPSNVVISRTSGHGFLGSGLSSVWRVRDLKIQTASSGNCIQVSRGTALEYDNLDFGTCATYHIYVEDGARVVCLGNYTISGGAQIHWYVIAAAILRCQAKTLTLTGTPAFTQFVQSAYSAVVLGNNCTFSGSATGARYTAVANGVLGTNGGGASYFPGSTAGSVSTGGQYI
jgi:hypothetical protein